jgi:hypothetical protein
VAYQRGIDMKKSPDEKNGRGSYLLCTTDLKED